MEKSGNQQHPVDTALAALVTIAKILGLPADFEQMRRAYVSGSAGIDRVTLLRAAQDMGLKAKAIFFDRAKLPDGVPLPAIAMLNDGSHLILLRGTVDQVTLIDLARNQPLTVPTATFLEVWSGELILVAKRVQLEKKSEPRFGLSWLLPVVAKYKRFLGQVLFVSLLLQLFGLTTPLFTQVVIDKVLVHRSASTLDVLLFGMFFVGVFQAVMTAFRSYLFTHSTNKIDVTLSSQLFRHISTLPLRYFEKWQVGDVVSRVRELDTIRQFMTGSALTLVLDVAFAVVYIVVMFFYSTVLTVITLVTVLAYVLLNLIVTPIFRRQLNERFMAGAATQSFLIEAVTGVQTLKTMAVERTFIERYEGYLSRYAKSAFASIKLSNIAGNLGGLIQQFFTVAVLWFGARIVMTGELSVGALIAFQMLSGQVIAPILRLVNMWQQFQQASVSIDRLGDIMNEKVEPAFNPNRTTLPALQGEVVLDQVSFRYRDDGAAVLRQISLKVEPGSRVGIVGRSGSGKSTLTKLLQRLYVPDSGRVMIDGVDLVQVEPAWLRRQVGVVLQENFLFNGSIAENIAIVKPEATPEEIVQAARLAGADEFIQELAEGYNTPVGERGSLLSGGQRQRIAIARALITDPRILIFDEATSALDYESERIIMDNLDAISSGRTSIMIAHRLSTVRKSDIIFVMERGQIVESGSHDELMAKEGQYFHLYHQQDVIVPTPLVTSLVAIPEP